MKVAVAHKKAVCLRSGHRVLLTLPHSGIPLPPTQPHLSATSVSLGNLLVKWEGSVTTASERTVGQTTPIHCGVL